MKKLFRKILLLSFLMTSILSIMSISITAEEFKQSKEINYKLRTDVHPKRIYIDGKSFYSEGIPKRYREYKEEHDGANINAFQMELCTTYIRRNKGS